MKGAAAGSLSSLYETIWPGIRLVSVCRVEHQQRPMQHHWSMRKLFNR
jgi:hypothetical protein